MMGTLVVKGLRERSVICQLGIKEDICIVLGKTILRPMQEFNIMEIGSNSFLRSPPAVALMLVPTLSNNLFD